ncbi:PREDICTED: RNA-binding protein with serine-rich domain 1-A isoform X1 [Drosophila arizonae]|uniref:RNA-binding protein with serine-rich domain 1-A isoform X1 n=1 Tax=Drosophila arizonae TaxID=7263 RepID=A0ABM1PZ07_DROAR|nr:PREDICTED: RNA-binding protein with serine-rich domain 1-A isoform X1 [Drosophila arizonae]
MKAWSPTPYTKRRRSRSDRCARSTPSGNEPKSKSKSKHSSKSHGSKSKKSKSSSKSSLDKHRSKERSSATSKSKKILQKVSGELKHKEKDKCCSTPSPRGCKEKHASSKAKLSEALKKSESKDKDKDKLKLECKSHVRKEEKKEEKKRRHEPSRERSHNTELRDARRSERECGRSKDWRSTSRQTPRPREHRAPSDQSSRPRARRSHSRQATLPPSYRRRSADRTPSPFSWHERDLKTVRLHIRGLTRQVTKTNIIEIFGSFGQLTNVDFPIDHFYRNGCTPVGRGFAFVEYVHPEDCQRALKSMDGSRLDGQRIIVSPFERSMLRFPLRRRYTSPQNGRDRY